MAEKEPRRSLPPAAALEERFEQIMDRVHQAGHNQVERVAALEEYLTLACGHEGETWFDAGAVKRKTAPRAAFPQPAGRFARVWQVLGSNQRRLSRRFYSPSLLSEAHAADQDIRRSRRRPGQPPSAADGDG